MRFGYYYKTSDGIRHESEIESPSRDQAFAELRKTGIRPIKLFAKGCLETARGTRGYGKRVIAAWVIAVAGLTAGVTYFAVREATASTKSSVPPELTVQQVRRAAKPRPRKQIASAEEMKQIVQTFKHDSDRFLALFAEPGRIPTRAEIAAFPIAMLESDLYDSFDDVILIEPDEGKATVDLKRVVAGLKDEAEMYLSSGKTVQHLVQWLTERQRMENAHREKIIREGANGDLKTLNEKLSELGFLPVE